MVNFATPGDLLKTVVFLKRGNSWYFISNGTVSHIQNITGEPFNSEMRGYDIYQSKTAYCFILEQALENSYWKMVEQKALKS